MAADKKYIQVTAAIIEKDGLIFCARRSSGRHLAGYWEFPGGKIEPNETPEECLVRELAEELSVQCHVDKLFGVNVCEYDDKIVELQAYRVVLIHGVIRLIDHDAECWLPASKLIELKWAPADVPFVRKLIEQANSDSR